MRHPRQRFRHLQALTFELTDAGRAALEAGADDADDADGAPDPAHEEHGPGRADARDVIQDVDEAGNPRLRVIR